MPARSPWDPNYGPTGGPSNDTLTADKSAEGTGSGDGTLGPGGGVVGSSNGNQQPSTWNDPHTNAFHQLQEPYIDAGGYDNSPSNEFSLYKDSQNADYRKAPLTDWTQANQSRGLQQQAAQSYQDVLSGKAPSLAAMQQQQGINAAANNSIDLAASARGGNALLAGQAAIRQNAVSAQQGINDASMLRASEQDKARGGLLTAGGQIRNGDQSQAEFGTQTQLQQQGLNDARYQNDQQTIGDRLTGRANFALGQNAQQTAAAAQEHQASQDRTSNAMKIGGAVIGGVGGAVVGGPAGAVAGATGGAAVGGAASKLSQDGVNVPQQQGLGQGALGGLGTVGSGQGTPPAGSQLAGLYSSPTGGQAAGGASGAPANALPTGGAASPSYTGGGAGAGSGSGMAMPTPSYGGLSTTPTGSTNGGAQGAPQPFYAGLMPPGQPGQQPKRPPVYGGM